jgi:circadian clock protein KaiB
MGQNMKKKAGAKAGKTAGTDTPDFVDLRLYVTDRTPRCLAAYENIRTLCEEYAGSYRITVIDLLRNPELARAEDITAIPTLVRIPHTTGRRKIVGMLSDKEKVLEELDLVSRTAYTSSGTIRAVPAH